MIQKPEAASTMETSSVDIAGNFITFNHQHSVSFLDIRPTITYQLNEHVEQHPYHAILLEADYKTEEDRLLCARA